MFHCHRQTEKAIGNLSIWKVTGHGYWGSLSPQESYKGHVQRNSGSLLNLLGLRYHSKTTWKDVVFTVWQTENYLTLQNWFCTIVSLVPDYSSFIDLENSRTILKKSDDSTSHWTIFSEVNDFWGGEWIQNLNEVMK